MYTIVKFVKKVWDKLCITYEGTSEIKSSKLNILIHNYELFSMLPHEFITDMFTFFTMIVTSVHALCSVLSKI